MLTVASFVERTMLFAVGPQGSFWSLIGFSRGDTELSSIMCKEQPLSTMTVHRLHDRFGLGCVWFFDRRVALKELGIVGCISPFNQQSSFLEFPIFATCLIFLVPCPIFTQILQIGGSLNVFRAICCRWVWLPYSAEGSPHSGCCKKFPPDSCLFQRSCWSP